MTDADADVDRPDGTPPQPVRARLNGGEASSSSPNAGQLQPYAAGRDWLRLDGKLSDGEEMALAMLAAPRAVRYAPPQYLADNHVAAQPPDLRRDRAEERPANTRLNGGEAPTPTTDADAWWRDPTTIPPREFLYGRHYARGAVGATIGAGGRAKTTLSIFEAVSMASGRNLMTSEPLPSGPLGAWIINGEEDQDELDRRIAATCQRYGITKVDLDGRLFAQSARDHPMRLALMRKGEAVLDQKLIDQMVRFIKVNRIDVVMADPLISFHGVSENDNSHMDVLIKGVFGAIAGKTNSAIEVFHHPGKPKPGQGATIVEDGRGASAILWAVRSARVLNFMTSAEAVKLGISDEVRKLHIRIANGKANMGPLGRAEWMKLVVEILPNGDQVAVASSWRPADPFDGLTTDGMELALRLARTGAYRVDMRSPDWFGYALAKHLDLNLTHGGNNNPEHVAKVKILMETWRKNGVLSVETRTDSERKKRKFIVSATPRQFADDEFVEGEDLFA